MNDENRLATKQTNGVIKAPGKAWLHTDEGIQDGISYNVKYIGCIGINESMKSLSFEVRTQVARESIRRVAESAKLLNFPRRTKKNDDQINRILSNTCITQWTGMNVQLHINTQFLRITQLECNDILFQHTMQNISFACGGDTDIQDFVAYVAKDERNGRACYVFECTDSLANNVITTIGQAFELRFRKFLNQMPNMKSNNNNTNTLNNNNINNNSNNNKHLSSPKDENKLLTNHSNHHNIHQNTNHQNHHHHQTPNFTPQHPSEFNSNKTVPSAKKFNPSENFTPSGASSTNTTPLVAHPHHITNSSSKPTPIQTPSHKVNSNQHLHKIDDKLEKMPWFHGLMTRETAEKLLVKDGDYLVRETNKAERQYVLSGRYKGECRHIFLVDPSGVVRTKDRVFDNICHLIQYHQDNNIPIISKENELLLEHPVCK